VALGHSVMVIDPGVVASVKECEEVLTEASCVADRVREGFAALRADVGASGSTPLGGACTAARIRMPGLTLACPRALANTRSHRLTETHSRTAKPTSTYPHVHMHTRTHAHADTHTTKATHTLAHTHTHSLTHAGTH
jgi:hypothetical protein